MYIQITTKCNMKCAHCCFFCTEEGKNMHPSTFRDALAFTENFSDSVSIGGGEPTLHPQFWRFVSLALGRMEYVWLATNGSNTEISLTLAGMARKGILSCALSQDEYHDPIDPAVIQAFRKDICKEKDLREIRTVSERLIDVGRAKENQLGGIEDDCACGTRFITPTGAIRFCGCEDSAHIGCVQQQVTDNIRRWMDLEADCIQEARRKNLVTKRNGVWEIL